MTGGILAGWATISGASWATLSGATLAPYTSATPVNSSTTLSASTNYDISGSLGTTGAANSLRFINTSTAAAVNLNSPVSIATGGIFVPSTVTSADSITGTGSNTLEGASGADLVVIQNSTQPLTISCDHRQQRFRDRAHEIGQRRADAHGPNTYSGTTTLNAGTLNINNANALGSGTLVINGGTIDNTFGTSITTSNAEIWNGNFTFQGTNPLSQSGGAITLTASPTITVASSSNALTIGGNIGGSFGITLAGSGTLALGANNTFTGGVTINGGTLLINNAAALNSTAPNVVSFGSTSTGTLNLNGNSLSVGGLSSTSTARASKRRRWAQHPPRSRSAASATTLSPAACKTAAPARCR